MGKAIYPHEYLYSDVELWKMLREERANKQKEEIKMTNPVELIKNELCSRYNLSPDQIIVNVSIDKVESVELANQIKNEYEVEGKVLEFLRSYNGYNQHIPEINSNTYVVCADHGTNANKENILNVTVRTKNGVLKDE